MSKVKSCNINRFLVLPAVLALSAGVAWGHVNLITPNGGEQLEVCSVFTVRWQIAIAHNLQNWDLWYSKTSATGPWIPFATNLPAGSGAVGSIHTYAWTIPADIDGSVWVRVRMDNSGTDYYDVSDGSFSIDPVPADVNGDYVVNALDLIDLLFCLGEVANPPCDAADVDGNGVVNALDLIDLLLALGDSCP